MSIMINFSTGGRTVGRSENLVGQVHRNLRSFEFRRFCNSIQVKTGGERGGAIIPMFRRLWGMGGHILFEREPKKYSTSPDNCRHIAKKDLSLVGGLNTLLEFYFEKQ